MISFRFLWYVISDYVYVYVRVVDVIVVAVMLCKLRWGMPQMLPLEF